MSLLQNNLWLESQKEKFENSKSRVEREKILKELGDSGFEDEATELYATACRDCLGTGLSPVYYFDVDSKEWIDDGEMDCHCMQAELDEAINDAWADR